MKNSGNVVQVAVRFVIFLLMPGLLLTAHSSAQSITMPRTRDVSSIRNHLMQVQSDRSAEQVAATPATDEPDPPAFRFVSIDVPHSVGTLAAGINARGSIVGIYFDKAGNEHGFLLKKGNFSKIDVPGSLVGVSGTLQSEANGINSAGDIVGDYFAPPGAPGAPACTADSPAFSAQCRRGFLYPKGQFSDVLVPGKKGSIPNAISPDGMIYGCDHDDDYFASMVGFGRNGLDRYITLDAGGGELEDATESVLASMNNGATNDGSIIVGLYVDPPQSDGKNRGYVVKDGRFHPYDVPGSVATQIWGISPAGDFVGLYDDAKGEHGFLQHWGEDGPITIDVPSGSPFNATLTDAFAINSRGMIVGAYMDASGGFHGYLAVRRGDGE
jgi:uncharacterized membrane protein